MKFIADAMLGKLARRLRLLGIDVRYDSRTHDNEVLRLALVEQRTILTRDRGLAARPLAVQCLLIESDRVDEQIVQLQAAFPGLRPPSPLTRCSVCNSGLEPVGRDAARDLVPDHVFRSANAFLRCPGCGRVYWRGSHVKRMGFGGDARIRPASS